MLLFIGRKYVIEPPIFVAFVTFVVLPPSMEEPWFDVFFLFCHIRNLIFFVYICPVMIEVKDATLKTGGHVVCNDLSFMAMDGQLTCVLAQDAEALEALLHAFLGLQPLESGYVSVDGECVTPLSAPFFRRMMAYVPARFEFGDTSVSALFHLLVGMEAPVRHEQKTALLRQWQSLGVDESCYERLLRSLPAAVRQRVMLSFAGVLNRNIILLNQPTAWQTPESAPLVLSFMQTMKAAGHLVLCTTTDRQVAETADVVINFTP